MGVKYTPIKCVAVNFGFAFDGWAWYFDFHKVNIIILIYFFNLKLTSKNNGHIYGMYSIIKHVPFCGLDWVLVWINQPKNVWMKIL